MKNIYLVGFMGSGKTVVGRLLAQRLNKEFVEMDEVIEKEEGKKIVDIFAKEGEDYFRRLEKNLLNKLSKRANLVVSCGGGLICNEKNLRLLKKSGIIILLKAKASTIYERTKKYTHRPLLNVDNPFKKIEELLARRKPYYDQAHYAVDTDKLLPEDIAEKIIKLIEANYG